MTLPTLSDASRAPETPAPATGHVLPPLRIGPHVVDTPVVLAPMAGVTNAAFRRLCREHGAGLYVAEMVTSRALVERNEESLRIVTFEEDEATRSAQVYGVDPATVGAAVKIIAGEDRADHVDLNFGCPVPKVTRKGGGSALPWKRDLFTSIVRAAVKAAEPYGVPVTIKMRKGIDEDHLTYLEAGLIAQAEGVAAVALHARTAADYYSGTADWSAIARLKETVTEIPVLGNGDIWSAEDAVRMVRETGCDGVVVGRGCQGRPWLFADLAAAFSGSDVRVTPGLREVAETIYRHGELMIEYFGGDEGKGMRDLRKHMAWYLKGYAVGGEARQGLAMVSTLEELRGKLDALDLDQPYPGEAAEGQRGRAGSPKKPHLPYGWLDSRELSEEFEEKLREAELSVSGG
ncbi:tRNA dihydrouridine synthase DusB [Oerskovia enterophila]|uniref:tRNA-dihydrouridine synthase n=1 Tax=Oerskovia enterophila TaxID=43678 RepID=A0A163R837_9CELL|nr:tRNA-dihydrouridine synthase [Oerskovia sp. Root22]KRD36778.1 tRNA-dihydrouridine synthase [Oerskovia sp. Root918]KZM34940.1 putative tRNA-dihydrouridine synthase [Oerskovia enterophila]OCI31017.1 putative tRNA-dihydrouridine synthase [Oerskovia enterophila]